MKTRNRILLLASLLLLVSVGGIGNIVWQLPHIEQMQNPTAILRCLLLLAMFGVGLIFSVLELVRQEIMSPIFQLAVQVARLKGREIDGHRLELTGSKDIDLLTRALNDLLEGFQKEEDFYHILVETSPDMIFLLDREGCVLFGNMNAARQWNYQAEEIIGKRQEELFPPDIAERHKQVIQKVFNSGQPVFLDVHETIGQHQCWIDARMIPVLNKDGHVTAVLGISRDITERKKAEETLRQTEERYEDLADSITDIFFAMDKDLKYTFWNRASEKLTGIKAKDALGKSLGELFPDTPQIRRAQNIYLEVARTQKPQDFVNEYKSDGKNFIFEINAYPSQNGLSVFVKDITARKRAEERLERVNRCLLGLGPDFNVNVGCITALSGELLNGTCALYNRLESGMLSAVGQWRTPPDFQPKDTPDGHVCYDVIRGPGELLFIPDLHKTRYAETDPNVRRYELQSYLGQPVRCGSVIVGSLCVAFQQTFTPTENDRRLLSILASALSVEESRHFAEQKLNEIKKKFQNLVETVNDFVWEADTLGHYTYASPRIKNILGYEPEEVIGKTPFDLMPAEEARRIGEIFKPLATNQQAIVALENVNLHKDGHQVVLETNGLPFFDAEGNLKGYRGVDRDITERKRNEKLIAAKTAEWQSTFDSMADGISIQSVDYEIINVNAALCGMLGKQKEKLIGKKCYEIFHNIKSPLPGCPFEKSTKKAQKEYLEIFEPLLNAWLAVSVSPVINSRGEVIRCVHVVRDITGRKRAETALQESRQTFKDLVETTNTGYVIIDTEGKILDANPEYVRLTGYHKLSEIRGRSVIEWTADYEKAKNAKAVEECVKKGYIRDLEIDYVDSCGKITPIEINATVVKKDGLPTILTLCRDITKRKQAEAKAAMLASAIENAHHGCLVVSEDYKVVFSNNYALTKLGFESDELKNLDLFSLCADREQVKDITETMKVTKRWMGEIAIIKKDGGQFPALVSVTALDADDDASGKGGDVILFQDITIQKEMREKLLTSEKLAVMGRLTADVAHELNNPLAIVIGGTQLVLSRIDEKAQTTFKSQLETVLRNARRCKSILGNLLGYGRTIGKKEEAINLPNLIREAIDDVNYQHDMSAIETVLNYSEFAVAEITGNKSALLSVFVNLIRNARQAMGEKGRLTVTIEKEDAKHLRIEIHDTGIGMNKEQKTKLFKPFASGWKEKEGSGLGLATSLGIIETHGGSMSAASEGVGKGATFTILLPCEFKRKK